MIFFTSPLEKLRGHLNGQVYLWVIGSPRSGSTYLTLSLGKNTSHCFNEPIKIPMFKRDNVDNWKFPACRSIVFKWCENHEMADKIIERFPNSYFLHTIRDPANNIYSIAHPKSDSWPRREFEQLGEEEATRIQNAVGLWEHYMAGCLGVRDKYPDHYIPVPYTAMPTYFPIIENKIQLRLKRKLKFTDRDLEAAYLEDIERVISKNVLAKRLSREVRKICLDAEKERDEFQQES